MRSFRTERTNSLFAADVVSSACVYVPSLLKFSKTTGAQSTDGHDEVLRPGMGVASPADSRQQQGDDLAAAGPPSATLNCQVAAEPQR